MVLHKLLLISLGGAMGALARYGLAGAVQRGLGSGFPWGTAVVNIIGCWLFGLFWAITVERGNLSADVRTFIFVGFLGSFTTFSTLISESGQLLTDSEMLAGLGNIAFQLITGFLLFFLGLATGRII